MFRLLSLALILILCPPLLVKQGAGDPLPPQEFKSGVVASAHPLASQVGVEILKAGGNAVDAAVATAFALGVVEPNASGIGGGGYMLIYLAHNQEVASIDYRETAPARATAEVYRGTPGQMKAGLRAVAVPGTLAGLALALQKYGALDLKTVLQPAIRLADQGFPVTRLLSGMMAKNAAKLAQYPAAARIYLKNGRAHQEGNRLYQKDLAETYRLIAAQGPEVFYRGPVAEAIVTEMKRGGGLITREDLASYRPIVRPPVKGAYRGYEIYSMGPSGSGTQVIQLLNILEGFDLAKLGHNTFKAIAIMAQAMIRVFADRAKYMGDPNFVNIPLKELLSREHAEKLRKTIKSSLLKEVTVARGAAVQPDHTSHLSVADKDGNLVSLTQSLNSFFGAGVVVPGTGILLNNDMGDFNPEPGQANSIAPGKRPLSSMSPTLVLKNGKPHLSLGMPGATRIISGLPQILMNIIDYNLPLREAIRAPRIHCVTGLIYLEARIPPQVRTALIRAGYQIEVKKDFDLYFGGAQGVGIDDQTGMFFGAADPRREGAVSGY